MTYQNAVIKMFIHDRLNKMGVFAENAFLLDELISKNIRRLNEGDKIAVDIDEAGNILALKKIEGFGCLHKLSERALIFHYAELERYFNEQPQLPVEFSE
jgi:hypothetical protein